MDTIKEKDGSVMKTKNAARTLLDTGLLFEINRRVLHPFGLALVVNIDLETKEEKIMQVLQDNTDDPEGLIFDEETLASGSKKFQRFMDEEGKTKFLARLKGLGYVIQDSSET